MKLEFPDEASRLAADSKALKELDAWIVEKWLREKKKIPKKPARFERYSPKGRQQRKRFFRLCHGIRLHRNLSDYRMADLLNLMERPPEFTWREIQTLYEATKDKSADEIARRVAEAIEKDGDTSKTIVTALFHKLVEFRERNIGHAVEQDLTSEIEEVLREVHSITQLLRQLIVDASVVDSGMLRAQEWYAIMRHARRWSTWTAPKEYIATRRAERELLSELSRTLSPDAQVEVVGMQVSQYDPDGGRGSTREFEKLLEEILAKFEITACDRLLARFASTDGMTALYSRGRDIAAEKYFAFGPSAFHTSRWREPLIDVLSEATESESIAKNALQYLRMLAYAAGTGDTSFDQKRAQELIADHAFVGSIFKAATAWRLNRRVVGSLEEYRATLLALDVPEEVIPWPEWWGELHAELVDLPDQEAPDA